MRRFSRPLLLLLLALPLGAAAAQTASPEGYWLTKNKDGIIQIVSCGADGTLCGRLVWFRIDPGDPNPQALDLKNPDPAKRNQSLCGITLMHGFKPTAPNHWEDGLVYDPDSGETYHAIMSLRADGSLDLHGYIGITLFGRSEIWTRYTEKLPTCPTR